MEAERWIIHLDLDAFFCAVEEQRDAGLLGKSFAVGGRPESRGVVSSCSYAARRFGVRSAMPMAQALRLCPELILVSPHYDRYQEVSQSVMARLHALTPLVEQISIDEAFLDVSDLEGPVEDLARRLQSAIREELGLPSSLGIARNKLVAKIATDVGKAAGRSGSPPCALTLVPQGREADFLAPLPVGLLWGVGPKTAARLEEIGLRTIGDLARLPEVDLLRRFGQHGLEMSQHARGIDLRPVVTEHEPKSFSQEVTFARDVRDEAELRRTLRSLSEGVSRRLSEHRASGSTVKLKLRWPDFTTLTRQVTLRQPTDAARVIHQAAEELFDKVWSRGRAVRLLGVGVSGLSSPVRQLGLWEENRALDRERRLKAAITELEGRFGKGVLSRGFDEDVD